MPCLPFYFHLMPPRNCTPLSYALFWILQFVVGLGDKVSPTDIEEGMRVGYAILYFQIKHIISLKVFSSFTISYLVIHFYYNTMMHLCTRDECIQNWPIFPVIICKKMICHHASCMSYENNAYWFELLLIRRLKKATAIHVVIAMSLGKMSWTLHVWHRWESIGLLN